MPVNLKISLGTVALTDWLHVTASKVSSPSTIVYETWIDVPVTNYDFIIPGLDPDNYFIRYYDAPDNVSVGQLRMEILVNALTSEFVNERRFYTCGGSNTGDPTDGTFTLTDPYLIGKSIKGIFKEGFRYLKITETTGNEVIFNAATGTITKNDTLPFSLGEVFTVEIQYKVAGSTSTGGGALYTGTMTITTATQTLLAADKNKRVRLLGTGSTQVVTLPLLSAINIDDGFYFDNCVGGAAIQVKLLLPSTDRIKFNGFFAASDFFAEFWVSKGEHLLLRKLDSNYWEVITEYKGVDVGQQVFGRLSGQAGFLPENGSLYDGNVYGRLYWYIKNILPTTHVKSDTTVTSTGYVFDSTRPGQFVIDPNSSMFRMPNTQGLSQKALANFATYGSDSANRPYDYPGGFQAQMLLSHNHAEMVFQAVNNGGSKPVGFSGTTGILTDSGSKTGLTGGSQQRVDNFGGIYMTKI